MSRQEAKFKVGDRVRALESSGCEYILKGKFYTVAEGSCDGRINIMSNERGSPDRWDSAFFEPAPLFAVGDKVRLLEDNKGYGEKGDTGIIQSIGITDCYIIFDRLIRNRTGWYAELNNLEHATTDEEAVRNGTMSVNEARSRDGLPPISDAPKFKVGDRVKDISDTNVAGMLATVKAVREEAIDVQYDNDKEHVSWFFPNEDYDLVEEAHPGAKFHIGDRVFVKFDRTGTVLTSSWDDYAKEWVYGVNLDFYVSRTKAHIWRESDINLGSPKSTTGFTIPTDEEALPPKVSNNTASKDNLVITMTADTFDVEEGLDRIHKKLKKIARLSNSLGISVTAETA